MEDIFQNIHGARDNAEIKMGGGKNQSGKISIWKYEIKGKIYTTRSIFTFFNATIFKKRTTIWANMRAERNTTSLLCNPK